MKWLPDPGEASTAGKAPEGTILVRTNGYHALGERAAVVTEVEGSARVSGHHSFELHPEDPVETGFLLR